MRPLGPLLLLLATALLSVPAGAKIPLDDDRWIEVRSPHFVFWSRLSDKETRRVAERLEGFRSVVGMLTTAKPPEKDAVPTRIFLFRGRAPEYGLSSKIDGYFRPGLRNNDAIARGSGKRITHVMRHEYAHFLIRNQDSLNYPTWFSEGFAELLATIEVDGEEFEIGNVPDGRQYALQETLWMSFDDLLSARSTHEMSSMRMHQFYAQSWALVHYLSYGRPDRAFSADMSAYLKDIESGISAPAAFENRFGIATKKLRRTVRTYVTRKIRYFRGRLIQPSGELTFETRTPGPVERRVELGWLAFRAGSPETAREAFEAVLASDPENPRALSGIGDLHKFAYEYDEAAPWYERALAAAPNDVESLIDAGEYALHRAEASEDPGERKALARQARRHFAKAHREAGDLPEILWAYGSTFLLDGEDAAKGLEALEAAHTLLPSHPSPMWALAQARAAAGDATGALPLMDRVLAWQHSPANDQQLELRAAVAAQAETEASPPTAADRTEPDPPAEHGPSAPEAADPA